jgi:hypothetical protein
LDVRVKSSQSGISRRRRDPAARGDSVSQRLAFVLSGDIAIRLQKKAQSKGMTTADFAAALLEAIVRDNLYAAVINGDVEDEKNSSSRLNRRRLKPP